MLTWRSDERGTMTRFGTVTPPVQFKLEAVGRLALVGQMVRKLGAVVLVTVTFKIAAETPAIGTPPAPVTWTVRVPAGPSVLPALGCPLPARVSVIRAGVSATSPPAVP